jgi:hypothetical protein
VLQVQQHHHAELRRNAGYQTLFFSIAGLILGAWR